MPSILIVEDERVVARDIEMSLRDMGYDIVGSASSADEALVHAGQRCPDLVLMDIRIKGKLDGIEAAKILRRRFDIPIVYLTAYADAETIRRASETEAHGYIVKPFSIPKLRGAIEVALFKHQMEQRLKERERWFSTTLRSIGDAVIAVNQTGDVTFMNLAAELLIGTHSEQASGRKLTDIFNLVDERTHEPLENPMKRVLEEGKVIGLPPSCALLGASGTRPIEDSTAPIVDDSGNLLGAVIVFRDVSEQRRLQKQLILADRLSSLGTLAAGVGHEINNPLTFATGNVSLVLEDLEKLRESLLQLRLDGNTQFADSLQRLEDAIRRLNSAKYGVDRIRTIVADLQAFARPEKDDSWVDVTQSLKWALRVTANQIRPRAKLIEEVRPVPPVAGSSTRIGQVFINLLINAAHAIGEGNAEDNQIAVSTSTDDSGRVVISVRDTGCGIAPDLLNRIFDPFFTTKEVGAGTGLGLSICHGIVTSMGGEIGVESAVGKGTTFRVYLPAAKPQEPPPISGAAVLLRRARILVVDDEPEIAELLQRMLQPLHDATAVTSATEALALLTSDQNFDVVICDLTMPELSGMELYQRVLALFPRLAERMVFMTGGAFSQDMLDFIATVTNFFVYKPFSPPELLDFVQTVLRSQRPDIAVS